MKQAFVSCLLAGLFAALTFGAEFQVNTHASYDQKNAALTMDAAGNFVVVWCSYLQDGSSNGVFGQRFDPNCRPVGEEFQVNTTISGNQTEPAVATDAAGNFVVAWHGPGLTEDDREDIFARRFDAYGLPVGEEFRVNSDTSDRQLCPAVAMSNNGTFVVVWEGVNIPEEGNRAICGQLYDGSGTRLGAEFVADAQPSVCRYPDVAMDSSGNFAVVWMRDKSTNSILARLYSADASARTDTLEQPWIAMDAAGRFLVTWDGDPELAGLDNVHARLFEPDGAATGEQFVVNTILDGAQQGPRAAMNDGQEFVIVWDSRIDPNVNERDISGRRYDGLAGPIGDEFRLNTYAEGDQRYPAVAIRGDGCFVAVWQSDGQDGSGYGIFAKAGPIVCAADLNGDGLVNLRDFCCFAQSWCEQPASQSCDLNDDQQVDIRDLALLCRDWLSQ